MNDDLILELVAMLDGNDIPVDSITKGIEYFVADVEHMSKIYRLLWLFEGNQLEILGVVNAYRREKRKIYEK